MKTIKTIIKYLFFKNKIKDPKLINIETVKYFIQGHIRDFAKNFGIVSKHILEQSSFREKEVEKNSPLCLKNGMCINCECSLQESLISDPACKHGCYSKMMNEREWEKFKEINNIKF